MIPLFICCKVIPNIDEILNSLNGRKDASNNFEMLMTMIFLSNCMKHDTWEYEQEYKSY